jgi:hypothetical protein
MGWQLEFSDILLLAMAEELVPMGEKVIDSAKL